MPVYTIPDLSTGAEGGSSVVGDSNNNHHHNNIATRDSDDHRGGGGGGMWGNENEYRVFKLARELMNLPVTNGQGMENGDLGEAGGSPRTTPTVTTAWGPPPLNGLTSQLHSGLSHHLNGFPQPNGFSPALPKQNTGFPPQPHNAALTQQPPNGYPSQSAFSAQQPAQPQNGFHAAQQNGFHAAQQNGFHAQQSNGYSTAAPQHGMVPQNGHHQANHNNGLNATGAFSAPTFSSGGGAENGFSMYRTDSNSPERGDMGPPVPRRTGAKANTTETVRVPSSEHVAEIVGRQAQMTAQERKVPLEPGDVLYLLWTHGTVSSCKIKDLRAKTNTYIKTPVRGEEPVFVVTGRKEDVLRAMQEIREQSDHFSEIRANRHQDRHLHNCHECKRFVEVPYKLVGLVVGPKGATVKKIQEETGAYIITPNRSAEPVFEVRGKQSEVDLAAARILQHIEERTGHSGSRSLHGQPSSPSSSSSVSSMPSVLGDFNGPPQPQPQPQQQQQQHSGLNHFSYAPLTSSNRHNAQQNGGFGAHNGFGGAPLSNGFSNGLSGSQQGQHNGYSSSRQQQQGFSNGFGSFSNGSSSSGGGGGGGGDPFSGAGCWGSPGGSGQRYSGSQDGFSPAHPGLDTRRSSGSLVEEDRVFNNISSNFDFSNLAAFGVLSGAAASGAFGALGAATTTTTTIPLTPRPSPCPPSPTTAQDPTPPRRLSAPRGWPSRPPSPTAVRPTCWTLSLAPCPPPCPPASLRPPRPLLQVPARGRPPWTGGGAGGGPAERRGARHQPSGAGRRGRGGGREEGRPCA